MPVRKAKVMNDMSSPTGNTGSNPKQAAPKARGMPFFCAKCSAVFGIACRIISGSFATLQAVSHIMAQKYKACCLGMPYWNTESSEKNRSGSEMKLRAGDFYTLGRCLQSRWLFIGQYTFHFLAKTLYYSHRTIRWSRDLMRSTPWRYTLLAFCFCVFSPLP